MALITRNSSVTIEPTSAARVAPIPASLGITAGEALDGGAPCYIHSDGKAYMSNGTADNAAAAVSGWCPQAVAIGQPVTLFPAGVLFEYGTDLTPGAILYVGATKGRLDAAATTGDATGVARCVSATHIRTTRAN
jgi:hypothetical protein